MDPDEALDRILVFQLWTVETLLDDSLGAEFA